MSADKCGAKNDRGAELRMTSARPFENCSCPIYWAIQKNLSVMPMSGAAKRARWEGNQIATPQKLSAHSGEKPHAL